MVRYFVATCMSQRKSAEVEGAILPRLLATDIVESFFNQITRKKSGPENVNTGSESAGVENIYNQLSENLNRALKVRVIS